MPQNKRWKGVSGVIKTNPVRKWQSAQQQANCRKIMCVNHTDIQNYFLSSKLSPMYRHWKSGNSISKSGFDFTSKRYLHQMQKMEKERLLSSCSQGRHMDISRQQREVFHGLPGNSLRITYSHATVSKEHRQHSSMKPSFPELLSASSAIPDLYSIQPFQ